LTQDDITGVGVCLVKVDHDTDTENGNWKTEAQYDGYEAASITNDKTRDIAQKQEPILKLFVKYVACMTEKWQA
jgi:hypothetical protein